MILGILSAAIYGFFVYNPTIAMPTPAVVIPIEKTKSVPSPSIVQKTYGPNSPNVNGNFVQQNFNFGVKAGIGNLKQRTTELIQEISASEEERARIAERLHQSSRDSISNSSSFYRWKYLARIREIRDEYAALHIKDDQLDSILATMSRKQNLPRIWAQEVIHRYADNRHFHVARH